MQDKPCLSRAACLVHPCKVYSSDGIDSAKPVILQSLLVSHTSSGIASLLAASWPLLQEPHSLYTFLTVIISIIIIIIVNKF